MVFSPRASQASIDLPAWPPPNVSQRNFHRGCDAHPGDEAAAEPKRLPSRSERRDTGTPEKCGRPLYGHAEGILFLPILFKKCPFLLQVPAVVHLVFWKCVCFLFKSTIDFYTTCISQKEIYKLATEMLLTHLVGLTNTRLIR